ncbi:MAG: hypothetical protein ACKOHM_05145 [Spartobacteria bacterium]
MKNTSTLAPLLIGSLVAMFQFTATPAARAFGGPPGGPSSNGNYFPNDGTFSAVVRGENLTGTVQFSTTAGSGDTGAGSTGVSTIFYDGDTYQGNSQGAYNPQASTMTVNFQADVEGQGENTIIVRTPITTLGTSTTNGTVTNTSTTTFQPTRQYQFFDSLYLNGAAECKTSNAFPNQKFSGSGEAEFQQLEFAGNTPFLDAVRLPISVSGVRLSNTSSTFTTANVRPPSQNEFSLLVP